ncbi:hypothetical protein Sste5346_002687 [Sporothrix stenoceras]|uniref:Cytochrome P450 n=1 Tax=Sporothrix stenoceras TaxID=5173 RepID=A0ABR3ZGL6_9PEZI
MDIHRLIYTVAGVLLVILLRSVFRRPVIRRHGVPLPKPPNTLPLLGNGILFLQARQKLFAWFVKCQQQFGYETFQVAVPTLPPGVVINDPKNLEYIFKNEGTLISKGNFVKGMLWDLFGYGIVNADGDVWRTQRKAGLSFLSTANIRVLTDVALPKYLADTISHLREQAEVDDKTKATKEIDLQAVFHELTSRIMGRMAYNMEMHADDEFSKAFDYASGVTTERFQNPLWFITEAISGSAELLKSLAIVKAFGRRIVSTAVADRKKQHLVMHGIIPGPSSLSTPTPFSNDSLADSKINEVSGSLINSLLDAILDEEVVTDAALNYLSAGRDTVAQGLTWTFYTLMKHPEVVEKIRKEVQNVSPTGNGNKNLKYHSLTPVAMPYTMAVFYEGLRLFPPIPFEIKQVDPVGLTLPDGTQLERGSLIIWCSWALNRSRLTWGDDADEFRPERFLEPNGKRLVSRTAWEYPVFHGGPRTCLGKKMAESMAVQIMAAVAYFFDFELVDPTKERVTKTSLTLPMEGGLPCYVRARDV